MVDDDTRATFKEEAKGEKEKRSEESSASTSGDDDFKHFEVLDEGDVTVGVRPTIRVHGKTKQVCRRSLYVFSIHGTFRQKVILLVDWWWFDKFILTLIMLNSILLANMQYRQDDNVGFNWFFNRVADPVFTCFFTVELLLKVVALGLIADQRSYLRDSWNCLDLVVIISSLISFMPDVNNNLGFLRVFRVLKPLRGLSAVPQIKVLVRTMINCIPKLGSVAVMGAFFFGVFGIVGIMLFDGVFYRRCRTIAAPELVYAGNSSQRCWSWPYAAGEGRLCGGRYACTASGGFCGGHEFDSNEALRPRFPVATVDTVTWCPGSEPAKLFLSSQFVHFDHMGGALLAIFQCMTLEGWTEVFYSVMDASPLRVAVVIYFLLLVAVTSFFLLNVSLAAIDSVFEEEHRKDPLPVRSSLRITITTEVRRRCRCCPKRCCPGRDSVIVRQLMKEDDDDEEPQEEYWLDVAWVRLVHWIAFSQPFTTMVMFLITANVVIMMFEKFPPEVVWLDFLEACNTSFLWAFTVEMLVMLIAMGPWRYITSLLHLFDGTIVVISWTEVFMGASSFSRAFRTLRVVLKLNKLARNWPKFNSMLKAMWATAKALKYWLVLFVLALYISTLMGMSCFANLFHFDANGQAIAPGEHWCPGTEGEPESKRQDCIPRAHFDTFLWAFVTVFQIFTGENWHSVMYDGMHAGGWLFAAYFVWLILFGQILVLSLFLSVLMAQFNQARVQMEIEVARKQKLVQYVGKIKRTLSRNLLRLGRQAKAVVRRGSMNSADGGSVEPIGTGAETGTWAAGREERQHGPLCVSKITVRPKSQETETAIEPVGVLSEDLRPVRFGEALSDGDRPPDSTKSEPLPRQRSASVDEIAQLRSAPSASRPARSSLPATSEQSRTPRLRLTPRQSDPKPTVELITSTFLEALGAPAAARQAEREADVDINNRTLTSIYPSSSSNAQADQGGTPAESCCGRRCRWCRLLMRGICGQRDKLRKGVHWLLEFKLHVKGEPVRIVESIVFLCITLSTVSTMFDSPLSDPDDSRINALRVADTVFSVIFTVEIIAKLIALGPYEFFVGPERTWNRLDTVVVTASLLDIAGFKGGAFKTLRIARAVRPLRIISRAPTLRIVIQCVLASLPGLLTLILVSIVCILVFALLGLYLYNGRMFHCNNADGRPLALSREVGYNFTTPLCLSPSLANFSEQWTSANVSCPNGAFRQASKDWLTPSSCPAGTCGRELALEWRRASADTPICVGRCDPHEPAERQPPERRRLCPRRFELVEELPSLCPAGAQRVLPQGRLQQEAVGQKYVSAMQRELVMPCGGSAVSGATLSSPAAAASCRATFCPGSAPPELELACRRDCERHPHFCQTACSGDGVGSLACRSCRLECEAACQCRDFCEPLVRDAALCVEQGLQWTHSLSQNFDNIANAMLTLFEISTTEGWVDVMYVAADSMPFYEQPQRDAEQGSAAIIFCFYIFFTYLFLVNLSVGLIVDNFIQLKQRGGDGNGVMLTPAQQKWVNSRKALYNRKELFNLSNLHLLSKCRRWVYHLVSGKAFDLFITLVIVLNVVCLALKVFPSHMQGWPLIFRNHWNEVLEVCNIVSGSIFLVEFLLKLYALQFHYWKDAMNVFDFLCLLVTGVGMLVGSPTLGNSLRIARCVRLLGYFKELQRLFRALLLTLPKFANVMVTFLLLLTMYGILGVHLFSPAKHSEEFAANGNFRNFVWAFLTLFRSSTGEAWNEIMHDLAKKEEDHFRDGTWCTPHDFYSSDGSWSVLKSKCLIDTPNSCSAYPWLPSFLLPILFWVSFTIIMTFLFMNLLLAVIIDSYQDCKHQPEAVVIDLCIERWKKYDPDHRAKLPLPKVMVFIDEVTTEVLGKKLELDLPAGGESGSDFSSLPMRYAQAWTLKTTPDGRVDYFSAFQQVFRFTCLEGNLDMITEIDAADGALSSKEAERLQRIEQKQKRNTNTVAVEVRLQIAAVKLQRHFRQRREERRRRHKLLKLSLTLPVRARLSSSPGRQSAVAEAAAAAAAAVAPPAALTAAATAPAPEPRPCPERGGRSQTVPVAPGSKLAHLSRTLTEVTPIGWLRQDGELPAPSHLPLNDLRALHIEDITRLDDLDDLTLEDVDVDGQEPPSVRTQQKTKLTMCLVDLEEEDV